MSADYDALCEGPCCTDTQCHGEVELCRVWENGGEGTTLYLCKTARASLRALDFVVEKAES